MRRRRTPHEDRRISSAWQLDEQRVVEALARVVALEGSPQARCLDANDRVDLRVEAGIAPERLHRDRVALEARTATAQGLLDDEAQKGAELG